PPLPRTLHGPSDRVLDGDRDREPEPHPDRPEITDAGGEPDAHHQEDDEAGNPQLQRLDGAPIDLALRVVHEFMFHVSNHRPERDDRRSRALASDTEAVPPPR